MKAAAWSYIGRAMLEALVAVLVSRHLVSPFLGVVISANRAWPLSLNPINPGAQILVWTMAEKQGDPILPVSKRSPAY